MMGGCGQACGGRLRPGRASIRPPARRRPLLPLLAAAALALSAGCGRGRTAYNVPSTPRPPAFSETPPDSFRESSEWKHAQPGDSWQRGRWWEIFQDADLNRLEEKVDASNQTLKSADARFRQARAFVREQRSAQFPGIDAGAAATGNHVSMNKPFTHFSPGTNTSGDFALPVDVSYEADVWGRVRNLVASAAGSAQATAADMESVRLSLHAELALDYFDLRTADEEKRIIDTSVEAYEKALDLTRRRFDGGLANRLEVSQAETQLEAARAQAIDVTEKRAQYEHAIAVLAGEPPETFSLPPRVYKPELPVIPVGLPSALLQRRPDIAAAERRVAAANSRVGFATAAFYPQFLLSANGGLEAGKIVNWLSWPSRLWAIGPSVVQPLFDAGRRRAQAEEATAGYDATVADYRQEVLSAFEQVEDALASLRILENEASRQQLAVEAAARTEALAMNRYKGGLVTYLDVVVAQSTALQNERIAIQLLRRRLEASVLLIKALGGGWDAKTLPSSF